jgi:hypothetical protein
MVEEHPKNLSLLTSPRSVLFVKKQIATTNNGCNTYYYSKRISMSMWMYACMTWQLRCNATYPKIKRNRNSDIHIYGWSCFTTWQFKCLLAWQNKAWVHYTKIKWSGENIISISKYSICYLLCEMKTITAWHDARCKQIYGWHDQILCIFLIEIYIKYFLFWVTVSKIRI